MAANDKKTTKQTLERVKAWANQEFVRNTVNNLVNYYLKSETYTKAEVQQLLNAIKQFTYQVAPSLPTASADTMNVIYLVPTEDPKTKNVKDEFITIDNGAGAATRYTWEQIGSTQIDLSGYYTSAQTDAAITAALNSALANYTTTTNLNTLLSGKVDKVSGKGLSTNDYTNEEKAKLGALPTEAELNNEFAISGVYDVSAKNPTAGPNNDGKFTLDYILDSNNVNTLIPTAYRKGGMSIKFVQSSDNKYVQYRLMADGWSTTETDWQGVDGEPTLNSNNLVESGGVERLIRYSTKSAMTTKDFAIGDENGNNILEIYLKGELKTAKFDSRNTVKSTSTSKDFAIGDENGNNVLEIYNGGELKTPKFDSDKTIEIDDYDSISQLLISDGLNNVILSLRNGNLRTKFFNSKNKFSNFSILGDSYSTFRGYTHPTSNNQWYPALDVQSVEDTWWYKFALQYGIRLIANNSYSGSTICYDGYGDGSADAKETSFVTRSSNIGEIPELILIFGGTNDSWAGSGIGEYKYSDWTEEDLTTFRPAVAKMLHDVKYNNIGSTVIFILNTDLKSSIDESVETICDYYDVELLKLENISKSSNHPNKTGMTQICEQLITFINNLKF